MNLIVHKSNSIIEDELALLEKHKVPIVVTSLGAVSDVVDTVHRWGGLVYHDIISLRHAQKAAQAVDGRFALPQELVDIPARQALRAD